MIICAQAARLEAFLLACEDAEALGGGEYVADLYDVSRPVSLDLLIDASGVDVLAALELIYDDEQGGWYLGQRIEDAALIAALIGEALSAADAAREN